MAGYGTRLVTNVKPLGTSAVNPAASPLTFNCNRSLTFDGHERSMAGEEHPIPRWCESCLSRTGNRRASGAREY